MRTTGILFAVVNAAGSYEFQGRIDIVDHGRMVYTVVYLPKPLTTKLGRSRFRVHAIINEVEVDGAFQPAGDGRHYLLVSKRLLRQIGARPGDPVEVRFSIADQDEVDVPEDVRWALPPTAQRAFAALTPGKRRAVLVPVAGARATPTRQRRIAALVRGLNDGTLVTGPPKRARRS